MIDNYIYKTGPNYFFIIFMLVGAGFCAFLVNLFPSNTVVIGASEKTGHLIVVVFKGFVALFGLLCLFMVIGFKRFYLTQDELIMSRPLLFYKRVIALSDLSNTSEADESISISRGWSYEKMNVGHKTTLLLKTGKKLEISSLEVLGYNTLIQKIKSEQRINRDRQHSSNSNSCKCKIKAFLFA